MKRPVLIFPVPKSPFPLKGRFGKKEWQDWYRVSLKAVNLKNQLGGAVLLISNFSVLGCPSEQAFFSEEFKQLGLDEEHLEKHLVGLETIEELEHAVKLARERQVRLIVISTWLHHLRVRWICRGQGVQHEVVFGLPEIKAAVVDLILTAAYPLFELLGKKEWFISLAKGKRKKGDMY